MKCSVIDRQPNPPPFSPKEICILLETEQEARAFRQLIRYWDIPGTSSEKVRVLLDQLWPVIREELPS